VNPKPCTHPEPGDTVSVVGRPGVPYTYLAVGPVPSLALIVERDNGSAHPILRERTSLFIWVELRGPRPQGRLS